MSYQRGAVFEDMQLRRASVGKVVKTFSTGAFADRTHLGPDDRGKFLMRARLGAR